MCPRRLSLRRQPGTLTRRSCARTGASFRFTRIVDAAVHRGCFHYLPPGDRLRYANELSRVLRPGGKFLLRASLRTAGVRNDVNEAVIGRTFAAWQIEQMERAAVPSDTRMLDVLLVRLTTRS